MENMNVRLAPSMKMALGDARESMASAVLKAMVFQRGFGL